MKWKGNREIKFIGTFIILLMIGQAVYFFSKTAIEKVVIQKAHVSVSVAIINLINPEENAVQNEKVIYGSGNSMTVASGCDGIDGMLIVISAMLAFPMALKMKTIGTAFGILTVYMTNLLRIVLLYYAMVYKPNWFEFMHIYIGQFMVIFVGGLFFLMWVNQFGKTHEPSA